MYYSSVKRCTDVLLASVGLVVLSPLFFVIAMAIKLSDGSPAFFRQWRVGQWGRLFRIWKFRTMRAGADKEGPAVTQDGDPRVTRLGWWLRKTKLDELPQLWNVLLGDMSFVGPRPEVPRYVARYTPAQCAILKLRPGITDLATLEFINEEELLRTAPDVEAYYLNHCVPRKIELNLQHAQQASLMADLKIIWRTVAEGGRLIPSFSKPVPTILVAKKRAAVPVRIAADGGV